MLPNRPHSVTIHKGQDPLKAVIYDHFHHYDGFVMVITGNPYTKMGVGKTWSAISIADIVDPNFNIDKVTFNVQDFLAQIKKVRLSNKKHQVVILDEGQTSVPSTEWYSITNKAIFYTLSVFRAKVAMAIIITSDINWIDKKIRSLITFWAYPNLMLAYNRKFYKLNFFNLSMPHFQNKIFYNNKECMDHELGMKTRIVGFIMDPPRKELIDAYQIADEKNKDRIQIEAEKAAAEFEKSKEKINYKMIADSLWNDDRIVREFEKRAKVTTPTVLNLNPNLNRTDAGIIAQMLTRRKEEALL